MTRNDEVQSLGMSLKASSLPVVTGTDGLLVVNNNALFDDTSLLMGVTLNYKMKHMQDLYVNVQLILIKHSLITHINKQFFFKGIKNNKIFNINFVGTKFMSLTLKYFCNENHKIFTRRGWTQLMQQHHIRGV